MLNAIIDSMEKSEERVALSEYKDLIKNEWQQAARVVDRLLLVIFVLLTAGVTVGLLFRGTISY